VTLELNCACCGCPISAAQVQYDVEMTDLDDEPVVLPMHLAYSDAWSVALKDAAITLMRSQCAGTSDYEDYRRCSIRSVQSTPLVTTGGELVGMISTHWSHPHRPTTSSTNSIS
jgi:hypothetical protein